MVQICPFFRVSEGRVGWDLRATKVTIHVSGKFLYTFGGSLPSHNAIKSAVSLHQLSSEFRSGCGFPCDHWLHQNHARAPKPDMTEHWEYKWEMQWLFKLQAFRQGYLEVGSWEAGPLGAYTVLGGGNSKMSKKLPVGGETGRYTTNFSWYGLWYVLQLSYRQSINWAIIPVHRRGVKSELNLER